MAKITINNILASFASTTSIDSRFQQVEDELNDKVLYRDNPVGEPNSMSNDLDMNGNDILNVGALSIGGTTITTGEYTASEVADVLNISELRTLDGTTAIQASLRGYLTSGDNAGGLFYWDSTSIATDNGGTIIKATGIATGRWKRIYSQEVDVRWFGAIGNGVADDTVSIQAAIDASDNIYLPAGTYKTTATLSATPANSFSLKGDRAILQFSGTEVEYGLLVTPTVGIEGLEISGIVVEGASILAYGFRVDTSSFAIDSVKIHGNAIYDLDNVSTIRSCSGIRVDAANVISTSITNNIVDNVTRTQVNPGVISSTGITVISATGNVSIKGNTVSDISSPSGDDDADGIVVFSSNRLDSDVLQIVNPVIRDNHMSQCKGRFVKLQSANGKIDSNYMSNDGIELIVNFVGIDSQVGGVNITNNTIRIGTYTGGGSAAIAKLQLKATGDKENIYNFSENNIILGAEIPYGVFVLPVDASNGVVNIKDNTVYDRDNSFRVANFVYTGIGENMDIYTIKVDGNTVPVGTGNLFRFTTAGNVIIADAVKGPLISDVLKVFITDNLNTLEDAASDLILFEASSGNYPYLQNLTILGNSGFTRNNVTAQGMDCLLLPEGTSFLYSTDGSTGGLINAPTGYDRFVDVERPSSNSLQLSQVDGSEFALLRVSTGAGYTYTGTIIP